MAESTALKGMTKEEKLELILKASLKCLATHGYSQTTLDLIAEKVGVSKGTLSYYFKNKEELIAAVAIFAGNRILQSFENAVAEFDSPAEKIHAGLSLLAREFSANHGPLKVYYDLFAQGLFSERLRQLLATITGRFREAFIVFLRAGEDGSTIDSEHNVLIKAALLGCLVDGIVKQIIIDPDAFAGVDVEAGMDNLFQNISKNIF